MTEDLVPRPEDPYGIAKYGVEMDLRSAHEMFGLDFVIFRPHNVYGEHQNIGDKYRNVIGIFMNQLMQGRPLTIFGDGNQTRAFSYIDDVAPYIAKSVNVPSTSNQTINIGADKPYSVNQLVHVIADALKIKPELKYLPARKEVVHAYSDHVKARELFHIQSTTPLEDGVRRMSIWAKMVGARQSQEFQNVEVRKNLPAGW
jgi:UDP-glucose 4-epimerase